MPGASVTAATGAAAEVDGGSAELLPVALQRSAGSTRQKYDSVCVTQGSATKLVQLSSPGGSALVAGPVSSASRSSSSVSSMTFTAVRTEYQLLQDRRSEKGVGAGEGRGGGLRRAAAHLDETAMQLLILLIGVIELQQLVHLQVNVPLTQDVQHCQERGERSRVCPHLVLLSSILVQIGSELRDRRHRWYRPLPAGGELLTLLLDVCMALCSCLLCGEQQRWKAENVMHTANFPCTPLQPSQHLPAPLPSISILIPNFVTVHSLDNTRTSSLQIAV